MTNEARLPDFSWTGTAGGTITLGCDSDEDVTILVGGSETDVNDLTDTTAAARTGTAGDWQFVIDVPASPQPSPPLRLCIDGVPVAFGDLYPSRLGAPTVDPTFTVNVNETTLTLSVAGPPGPAGEDGGVPNGGTTGQVLAKASGTNGDATWRTLTASDVGAATTADVNAAVATEATLARNADNLTSGTIPDARIPTGVARDTEVAAAIAAAAAGYATAAQGALADTAVQPADLAGKEDTGVAEGLVTSHAEGVDVHAITAVTGLQPELDAATTTFIYNSANSGNTPGVYASWPDLMAKVAAVPGNKLIQFVQDETIDATGMPGDGWDLNGSTLMGRGIGDATTKVTFADGVKVTNLPQVAVRSLILLSESTEPVITVSVPGAAHYFQDDAMLAGSGTCEIIRVTAPAGQVLLSFRNGSGFKPRSAFGVAGGDYEALNVTGDAAVLIAEAWGLPTTMDNTIRGTGMGGITRFFFGPAMNIFDGPQGGVQTNAPGFSELPPFVDSRRMVHGFGLLSDVIDDLLARVAALEAG